MNAKVCSTAKPSWFAAQGRPSCSKYGKVEIENLALAYVIGLSRLGDIWRRISPSECWDVLNSEEKERFRDLSRLVGSRSFGRIENWWEMLQDQLKDAEGAFDMGGIGWGVNLFIRHVGQAELGETTVTLFAVAMPDSRGDYCYLTTGSGDPPRTYTPEHANRYKSERSAKAAMTRARKKSPLKDRFMVVVPHPANDSALPEAGRNQAPTL